MTKATRGPAEVLIWPASGTQMARRGWRDQEWGRPDQGIMPLTWPFLGGDTGNRTPDLLLAKQALYQLSYVPEVHPVVLDQSKRSLR